MSSRVMAVDRRPREPSDLAPERVVGEQRLVEQRVHDVVGRVLVHEDLLEDHLALGVDLGRAEGGRADDVDQQVEPEGRGSVAGQPRVVTRCAPRLVKAFISPPTASTAIGDARGRCGRRCP